MQMQVDDGDAPVSAVRTLLPRATARGVGEGAGWGRAQEGREVTNGMPSYICRGWTGTDSAAAIDPESISAGDRAINEPA
jgi:hypothetical protein